MRHGMHTRGNSLAFIGYPYRPSVPGKAFKALYYRRVIFCNRFAVRMIPAAKARCAEALAGPYIGNGELCALIEPFAAAFEPIKQYYCAFQLIEICIGLLKLVRAVIYG